MSSLCALHRGPRIIGAMAWAVTFQGTQVWDNRKDPTARPSRPGCAPSSRTSRGRQHNECQRCVTPVHGFMVQTLYVSITPPPMMTRSPRLTSNRGSFRTREKDLRMGAVAAVELPTYFDRHTQNLASCRSLRFDVTVTNPLTVFPFDVVA